MYFAELTRNAFQSGISAAKWLALCKLMIEKAPPVQLEGVELAVNLSNSVLVLYRSYPGDPGLQDYLRAAIADGILPVHVFVSTLLQAARSTELHIPATLDTLCRIALDAHYASGLPPLGSVVPLATAAAASVTSNPPFAPPPNSAATGAGSVSADATQMRITSNVGTSVASIKGTASGATDPRSPTAIMDTVQDALALLHTAYSLQMSHFHQLTTSAGELLVLLVSCVTAPGGAAAVPGTSGDSILSHATTAQALAHFADATELMRRYRLAPEAHRVLDSYLSALTLQFGDDVKAAREQQMMHSVQYALGKGDILGPSSDSDVISLGLLLNYMVAYRAHTYGAGDLPHAVAQLVAHFRHSSWSASTFYTQLFVTAFMCMCQEGADTRLWKNFIVGRLPNLLVKFGEVLEADNSSATADLGTALQAGLSGLFRRPDVTVECDTAMTREASTSSSDAGAGTEEDGGRSVAREFLANVVKVGLVTMQSAAQLDPLVANEAPMKSMPELGDAGVDLTNYLESKIMQEGHDAQQWIDRIWCEPTAQAAFARLVSKRMSSSLAAMEVEPIGQTCKILHTYGRALDIVALHEPIPDLLFYAIQFFEDYDCETVGDPQTAVGHLGDVVLFVQYTLVRFKFGDKSITRNGRTVSTSFLLNNDSIPLTIGPMEERIPFGLWYKSLMTSSEGIEDNILRSTKPRVLLRIAPRLIPEAIRQLMRNKIEKEAIMGGVSYFTGPLLSWTLVGVINNLIREILYWRYHPDPHVQQAAPLFYEAIQALLLSDSCPRSVLALCSSQIGVLITLPKDRETVLQPPPVFQASKLKDAIAVATNIKGSPGSIDLAASESEGAAKRGWISYGDVQSAIQRAFVVARSGTHNAPFLDVRKCLMVLQPIRFLQLFWQELVASASMGELEACRRMATFVLTIPQEPGGLGSPPLLPIFLHVVLPSLIASADGQQLTEQTTSVELMLAIIASVLTMSAHLEWAMRSAASDDSPVLGQSSGAMSRRLAGDLRRAGPKSVVSALILQRLSSSSSFVATFPAFAPEQQ